MSKWLQASLFFFLNFIFLQGYLNLNLPLPSSSHHPPWCEIYHLINKIHILCRRPNIIIVWTPSIFFYPFMLSFLFIMTSAQHSDKRITVYIEEGIRIESGTSNAIINSLNHLNYKSLTINTYILILREHVIYKLQIFVYIYILYKKKMDEPTAISNSKSN